VSYTVVRDYKPAVHIGGKRTVSVRVNKRVSKEVLREISSQVKALEKEEYEITDINYYLPGMDTEGGSWASSRSSPTMNWVNIVGLTEEDRRFLENEPISLPDGSELIGCWLNETVFANSRFIIYRHNKIYYVTQSVGGSGFAVKLREVNPSVRHDDPHSLREVHDFQPDNGSIDHYVIDAEGKLRIYGNEGKLFATPEIIKPPLAARTAPRADPAPSGPQAIDKESPKAVRESIPSEPPAPERKHRTSRRSDAQTTDRSEPRTSSPAKSAEAAGNHEPSTLNQIAKEMATERAKATRSALAAAQKLIEEGKYDDAEDQVRRARLEAPTQELKDEAAKLRALIERKRKTTRKKKG
jgi:hypothetical protein